MSKGIVYISGPMSGIEDFNYPEFNRVADEVRAKGYTVINPVETSNRLDGNYRSRYGREPNWMEYLAHDIYTIYTYCDHILMLRGWEKSKGAQIEKLTAEQKGIKVLYQESFCISDQNGV